MTTTKKQKADLKRLAQQHAAHVTGIHPSEMKSGKHPVATRPRVKKKGKSNGS